MSVNKYKRHLYVIPEDDADRQIADGFVLHPRIASRQVQVVEPAGGWSRVLDTFKEEYLHILEQNLNAHVVMLIDFDENLGSRRKKFDEAIPDSLRDRVFVIGPQANPELLRQSLAKGFEDIGQSLADECESDRLDTWAHAHLRHNDPERIRLVKIVKPFLFDE